MKPKKINKMSVRELSLALNKLVLRDSSLYRQHLIARIKLLQGLGKK